MTSPVITSVQNPRVKETARLRDHRQRKKQRRFLIDGARELGRAIGAGIELFEVFVCELACTSEESRQVLSLLANAETRARCGNPEIWNVTPAVLEKLVFGERAEGVIGVGQERPRGLEQLSLPEQALVAVLEGIEKPGNIGAVMRSADAAGVTAIVVVDGGTDLYNPNTIRASLGTIFSLPVYSASGEDALTWLRTQRLKMFAARVDAAADYTSVDYRGRAAIVLGSEATGLSPVWLADDVVRVRLPMHGVADSLNVSATAAVLFYEALRQRTTSARK